MANKTRKTRYQCDSCGKVVMAVRFPKGWTDATSRRDLFKKIRCPPCRTDRP